MAAWVPAAVIALAGVVALSGCARTRLLVHTSSSTTSAAQSTQTATVSPPASSPPSSSAAAATRQYVAQLHAEEQTLAAAERRIPANAPTPRALSRSASLLAGAVSRLAHGLAAITPPPAVARDHAHLVSVVRAYAGQLQHAAALARRPGGQVAAGSLLVSATGRASTAFSATLSKIYSTLGVRQP
jgi:hypothetical protein